ncbi:hypothetical protein BC831DRAFT_268913 [Entophlyctis helioformis]|nr:hypothetical protein BC831DRAFT_268913 [Entophlyctis helioformis]
MSVSWAAIEERERDKKEQAKALKDFLKSQNEEIKQRKALEKLNEVQEFQRLYGAPQPQQQQQQPQQQQPRGNGPPLQHTPNATAPPGGHSDMFSYVPAKPCRTQSTSNASYGRPAVAPQPQRQSQMPSAMSSAGQSSSYSYASQPGGGINASAMAPFNASVGSLNNGGSSMPSSLLPASSYTPSPVSAVSASIGMPSPTTAFSSATAGGSSQPGIAEELLVRLRFTEDQLQQERRSRAWVESELQAGKSLLASLSARVDKLQEQSSAEASHRKRYHASWPSRTSAHKKPRSSSQHASTATRCVCTSSSPMPWAATKPTTARDKTMTRCTARLPRPSRSCGTSSRARC